MRRMVVTVFLVLMATVISSCGNLPSALDSNPVQLAGRDGVKQDKAALPPLSDTEKRILDKIGGELLPDQNIKIGNIIIHRREKEVSFPAKMCITESGEYGIEVLIALKNGRLHEALLVTDVEPINLQLALFLIGAENGIRLPGSGKIPQGSLMNIDVQPENGERVPVEKWLIDKNTSKELKREGWVFVGSSYVQGMRCLAKDEGNIVNVWSCGNTILDNPADTADIKHDVLVNAGLVPKSGSPVTVYLSFAEKQKAEDKK